MVKPKALKKSATSAGSGGPVQGGIEKPKKKPIKKINIGPAALGETRDIPVLTIRSGEKVVIDTSGKGTLNLRDIVMTGGTLEFAKNKTPLNLRVV